MNYTKGPWEILPERKTSEGRIWAITAWVDGEHCGMVGMQNCRIVDVYSLEGNARLIAAAPELYEACKALSEAVRALREGQRGGGTMGKISLADDIAQAALNKARGK